MRFRIEIENEDGNIFVPFNYNHLIDSVIYQIIQKVNPDSKIHSSKLFKYFTFSQIYFSKFKMTNKGFIALDGKISLFVSSPNNDLLKEILQGFLSEKEIEIEGNKLSISDIKMMDEPTFTNKVEFKTLSPIIVNSHKEIDGQIKRWDLSPSDENFFPFIERNLVKKYNMFYDTNLDKDSIKVYSILKNLKRKRISMKKGDSMHFHVCYMMDIILEGDSNLIKFAYDCGLSNNNSMGFGMLKFVKNYY